MTFDYNGFMAAQQAAMNAANQSQAAASYARHHNVKAQQAAADLNNAYAFTRQVARNGLVAILPSNKGAATLALSLGFVRHLDRLVGGQPIVQWYVTRKGREHIRR